MAGISAILLLFLPIKAASAALAEKKPFFPDRMPPPTDPGFDRLLQCEADPSRSPQLDQIRSLSNYLRYAVGPVLCTAPRKCNIVATWQDAGVYICNKNGINPATACGNSHGWFDNDGNLVNGGTLADVIDELIDQEGCVAQSAHGNVTGGVMWVNGPNTMQRGPGCPNSDYAAFITLRKSGLVQHEGLKDFTR